MTPAKSIRADRGPWSDAVLDQMAEWDPNWTEAIRAVTTNPWRGGVLTDRFVELVSLAVASACTSLDADGTRRQIRAALDAGATRDELLTILKMGTVMSIHSCSLGAPILMDEAGTDRLAAAARPPTPTPACDRMKAIGQWNVAWDPFFNLDPTWTDQFMAAGASIYGSGVFSAKETELLSIAFDASFTHMYAPGTRRHIHNALIAGASVAEIMEVLKICVSYGAATSMMGVPILAEELARQG